jgi:predicted TIM-barrel enzyme
MTLQHSIFRERKTVVGMVHVRALPGTPCQAEPLDQIIGQAADEARILTDAGCDALIIENMHDRPYLLRNVGPEIVSAMTAIGVAVRQAVEIPLGV